MKRERARDTIVQLSQQSQQCNLVLLLSSLLTCQLFLHLLSVCSAQPFVMSQRESPPNGCVSATLFIIQQSGQFVRVFLICIAFFSCKHRANHLTWPGQLGSAHYHHPNSQPTNGIEFECFCFFFCNSETLPKRKWSHKQEVGAGGKFELSRVETNINIHIYRYIFMM